MTDTLHDAQTLSTRYLGLLAEGGWLPMVVFAVLGAVLMVVRDRAPERSVTVRSLGVALFVGCAAWGVWNVWDQRAIFDDAFVTFHYIDNFMQGKGFVFNEGEYVEGYTNPLWAFLVTLGHMATGLEIPLVAVIFNVIVYVGLIATALPVAHAISGRPVNALPIAASLLAAQVSIGAYATTGMETLFGAWLVLGAAGLLHRGEDRHIAGAGLLLALAVVHRLDHAVFWCAGVLAVAFTLWHRPADRRIRPVLLYLAPTVLILVHLAWKYSYYGDILPNTFYAKAGDSWRMDQGFVYGFTYLLGTHGWIALPIAFVFVLMPRRYRETGAIRLFIGSSIVVWLVYLLKVGGDFMYGRFCIPLVPLIAVAAQAAIYEARANAARIALAAGLMATFNGVDIIKQGGGHYFGQAHENRVYPIRTFLPVRIGHGSWSDGNLFNRYFADRGIDAHLGTCCIGMVGYYSGLRVMDFHGLTDADVARMEIGDRSLPGHEKYATPQMMRDKGVQIARGAVFDMPRFVNELGSLSARGPEGRFKKHKWRLIAYDPDLVAEIREKAPEVRFRDMPSWLDQYLGTLYRKDREQIREELDGLKIYYFDHNDDPGRLAAIQTYVDGGPPPPVPASEWGRYHKWKRAEEKAGRPVTVPPPPRPDRQAPESPPKPETPPKPDEPVPPAPAPPTP
jgi:hypothetical protein